MSRYIDADEFLEDNKEFADREIEHPRYQETVRELINEAPTIEPKRGEWIIHSNGKMCDCSACNESYDRTFEYVDEWNYCPNCGARMKGVDDDTD